MKLKQRKIFYISILLFYIFSVFYFAVNFVRADNPGVIDTSNLDNQAKVCHDSTCTSFGIINFEVTGVNSIIIHSENGISGKVWGNELGWITMNPTGAGVEFANSETGVLTGKAWSQVSGWINFAPTGQSVTIDPDTGEFSGWAWSGGAYGGWIKFDCGDTSTCVKTTWRSDVPNPPGGNCTKNCGEPPACEYPFTMINGECACAPPLVNIDGWCSYDDTFPDVCPNIPYMQTVIPFGMHLESGQCVNNTVDDGDGGSTGHPTNPIDPSDPITPITPVTPNNPVNPTTPSSPSGGGGGGGGFIPDVINVGVTGALDLIEELRYILEGTDARLISRILTTLGLITGAFALVGIADLGLNLLRLWFAFLYGMGFKKRNRPWGVVYDSVTKQPLDPAYVVLNDMSGKEIASSITDIDGRYGFLVDPGFYRIVASKTNYKYPSEKLKGKTSDELYNDLYFGEQIEVKEEGEVIIKNIPLDRIGFDWNEFAKMEQQRMKFYHSWDKVVSRASDALFMLGFFVSVIMLVVLPGPYNFIIFTLYVLLFLLRRMKVGRNKKGNVSFATTNVPLSYGILRVKTEGGQEVAHRVLDRLGNYYCLVPNGHYQIYLEKKNDDSSYSNVFVSPLTEVKRGILKKDFKI